MSDHEALEKAYDAAGRSGQFHASLTEDERLRYAISAFLSSLDGCRLMPREPTEEMLRAAKEAAFWYPIDLRTQYRAMFDAAPGEVINVGWQPIETVPRDRYVLLFDPTTPRWDGNMDVGMWWGDEETGCFWSCHGPNGGLELPDIGTCGVGPYTHWMELPPDAAPDKKGTE